VTLDPDAPPSEALKTIQPKMIEIKEEPTFYKRPVSAILYHTKSKYLARDFRS
jgi:hypothetical protein